MNPLQCRHLVQEMGKVSGTERYYANRVKGKIKDYASTVKGKIKELSW